jgi:hypothetical protein
MSLEGDMPAAAREELLQMGQRLVLALISISVPVTNRQMIPGNKREVTNRALRRGTVILGQLLMDYPYLGYRYRELPERPGFFRHEALLEISGKLKPARVQGRIGGRMNGRALFDIDIGMISMAKVQMVLDMDVLTEFGVAQETGEYNFELLRNLPGL